MMNILINFSTLKSGGGQNVALNFLYAVESCLMSDITCYYLVARGSEIHLYLQSQKKMHYIVAPQNALLRILFEVFVGWFFLIKFKIDIVYSYFGYAWFPRRWPQISGSADSNLYFPEIDFWDNYHGLSKLKRKIVDFYRICGVKRANAVVFENEAMEQNGRRFYGLKHTKFIKPSICLNENNMKWRCPQLDNSEVKRGLFLCGWHLNKNIMMIPLIAAELQKRKHSFGFILTAPVDESKEHRQLIDLVLKLNVANMVFVTGPVHKDELSSLYAQIDYVFLLSKLESFSNNIIEAWHFGKPLLVSDELWSHSICQHAAVYVKRDSVNDIADKLCLLLDSQDNREHLIERGFEMLRQYPAIQERVKQEMEYVRYVFQHV